jgi:gamma-aminobutyric acid type B receptor
MAYKSLLLAFGVFMAWETRKVKMVSLNDSKYITMSVYNTVFMSIVAFAFSFISDEGTAYILVSFTIIIAVTVVLCLVFIPKIYTLMVKGDQGIEQSNKMASAERRISDHTIAKKSDIRELHRQNKHLKQIIRMLLEQVCTGICLMCF